MVSGRGLDVWSRIPGLGRVVVVGRFLRANRDARAAYAQMLKSAEYQNPIPWTAAGLDDVDAVRLPGGHRARGMRSYIDCEVLHELVVDAFRRGMLVAAICHGVLLAARSVDTSTGRSVLYGHQTTALTWDFERRGVAVGSRHAVLGPQLLPDLLGTTRRSRRRHVSGGGSHTCA